MLTQPSVPGPCITWFNNTVVHRRGVMPSVAVNASGMVVVLYKSSWMDTLHCCLGHVAETGLTFEGAHSHVAGFSPSIALNDRGDVVEVHRSSTWDNVYLTLGTVDGDRVRWAPKGVKLGGGIQPSVQFSAEEGEVVVVYKEVKGCLRAMVGQVEPGKPFVQKHNVAIPDSSTGYSLPAHVCCPQRQLILLQSHRGILQYRTGFQRPTAGTGLLRIRQLRPRRHGTGARDPHLLCADDALIMPNSDDADRSDGDAAPAGDFEVRLGPEFFIANGNRVMACLDTSRQTAIVVITDPANILCCCVVDVAP